MKPPTAMDRAAVVLGVASLVSAVFVFVRGDLEFVTVRGGGLVLAVALGALAVVAGRLGNRILMLVGGGGFLAAAVVLLVLLGARGNGGFLDGNGSTFALWLGLGVGLVTLGATPRDDTH